VIYTVVRPSGSSTGAPARDSVGRGQYGDLVNEPPKWCNLIVRDPGPFSAAVRLFPFPVRCFTCTHNHLAKE